MLAMAGAKIHLLFSHYLKPDALRIWHDLIGKEKEEEELKRRREKRKGKENRGKGKRQKT